LNDKSKHPFEHVDPAQLYEWMRQDCAAIVSARQSREDGIVQTIIQISSAALIAIPGFLLTSDLSTPSLIDGWSLYFGIILFVCALITSMLEQHFSAKAYKIHEKVIQNFYLLKNTNNSDKKPVQLVHRLRIISCIFFSSAVLNSMFGLGSLMGEYNGKSKAAAAGPSTVAAGAITGAW
jgi:hypothetical protein